MKKTPGHFASHAHGKGRRERTSLDVGVRGSKIQFAGPDTWVLGIQISGMDEFFPTLRDTAYHRILTGQCGSRMESDPLGRWKVPCQCPFSAC